MTNDPIKLAIEALSLVEEYGAPTLLTGVKVRDAVIALSSIKPDCRGCKFRIFMGLGGDAVCVNGEPCENGDKYQPLPFIQFYKVTK
jgi:hypothetical protein